jgi:hypothetical protein
MMSRKPGLRSVEAPLPSVIGGRNGTRNGAFSSRWGPRIVRPTPLCKSHPYCANFLQALPQPRLHDSDSRQPLKLLRLLGPHHNRAAPCNRGVVPVQAQEPGVWHWESTEAYQLSGFPELQSKSSHALKCTPLSSSCAEGVNRQHRHCSRPPRLWPGLDQGVHLGSANCTVTTPARRAGPAPRGDQSYTGSICGARVPAWEAQCQESYATADPERAWPAQKSLPLQSRCSRWLLPFTKAKTTELE